MVGRGNQGFVVHNLRVDALGIQAVAPRRGVAEVTLTDPPPGAVGTLVVSP